MRSTRDSLTVIAPADVADALANVLLILAEEVRRNPDLQRRLLAVLKPVVTVVPAGDRPTWFTVA